MYYTKILFFYIIFSSCAVNQNQQKRSAKNLIRLFGSIIELSYNDQIILDKETAILLVHKEIDIIKILVWNKDDVNDLLATLDRELIGYAHLNNYDVLFFNRIKNLELRNIKEINYVDQSLVNQYKKQLTWSVKDKNSPPPPPLNINPYVYYYEIKDNDFSLLKKGHNLVFP